MFLGMWNYLRGYVIIEVSGFSIERFLNLAAHKGIYLWNIHKSDKGITANVSIKGFRLLKPCAKKTKCHIKINIKKGVPFVTYKYRKRKILGLGIIFFIGVLYFLSSFIWSIEIFGNNRIEKQKLIDYSIKSGLKPGTYKKNIDLRSLEKNFIEEFNDISWISISIHGTKAKVELTETIAKTEIIDRTKPCNIVANKNGLIISIVTNAGTPKVKQKDVVEKGDLLVSGELIVGEEGAEQKKEYVHASAEVKAKLWYEFKLEEYIKYNEKIYTGETKKLYSLEIMGKKFNMLNTSILYKNYDKISSVKQLNFGGDFSLPISLIIDEYKEYTLHEMTRNIDEIKNLIQLQLDKIIKEQFNDVIEIVDKSIQYNNEGTKITANVVITTIERIDKEVEMEGAT